jgi:hypothetical protein
MWQVLNPFYLARKMGNLVDILPREAVEFTKRYHYTGSATYGIMRYGWEIDGELVGVSIYNTGTHAMRQGVFGPAYAEHVLHHHRLAISPTAPKHTASQFIAQALRKLNEDYSEIIDYPAGLWAVVTYADGCRHNGTIYRATNAIYTGKVAKGNLKFVTPEGVIVPTQSLKGTWPERRKEAANRGWKEIRCRGKYRYVWIVGTKRQQNMYPPMLWPSLEFKELKC